MFKFSKLGCFLKNKNFFTPRQFTSSLFNGVASWKNFSMRINEFTFNSICSNNDFNGISNSFVDLDKFANIIENHRDTTTDTSNSGNIEEDNKSQPTTSTSSNSNLSAQNNKSSSNSSDTSSDTRSSDSSSINSSSSSSSEDDACNGKKEKLNNRSCRKF